MEQSDLLKMAIATLERLQVPYAIVGSLAAVLGENLALRRTLISLFGSINCLYHCSATHLEVTNSTSAALPHWRRFDRKGNSMC